MTGDKKCRIHNSSFIIHNSKGFTLIEMLVSLALFSVTVTIATDLFFSFQRVSRKTEALDHLATSARTALELIGREVRDGTVAYARYAGAIAEPQTDLYLLNSAQSETHFSYSPCASEEGAVPCLTIARDGGNAEKLTGTDIAVRDAAFYIAPSLDPLRFNAGNGAYASNQHPRVTIFLSLDNGLSTNDSNYTRYDAQTTISSRIYRR